MVAATPPLDGPTIDHVTSQPIRDRLLTLVRRVAASGLAAVLAGVLVGGVGGRIMMRVSALLNPSLSGVRTSNGNRIDDITSGGTLALVVFGGVFTAAAVAWVWVSVRTWLPPAPTRHLVAAGVATTTLGFIVVEDSNFDFVILKPLWAHVLMFLGLVAAAGMLTSWLDARIRLQDRSGFTFPALIVCGFGALLAVPGILLFFNTEFCACDSPPRLIGILVLFTTAMTAASWYHEIAGRPVPRRLMWLGRAGVAAAALSGIIYLTQQVIELA